MHKIETDRMSIDEALQFRNATLGKRFKVREVAHGGGTTTITLEEVPEGPPFVLLDKADVLEPSEKPTVVS